MSMKIIYLLPPSEGKNCVQPHPQPLSCEERGTEESLSFLFEKPVEIALNASEKDLKCTGKRYQEGMEMNRDLVNQ